MRLPMYVTAGVLGRSTWRFLLWFMIAALLWVPLLVLLVVLLGDAIVPALEFLFGSGWLALVAAIAVLFVIIRSLMLLVTSVGRAKLRARVARLWRWEFWPAWAFYLPVLPWILWKALRHGGVNTITAANPGIPHGGLVGESKHAILRQLPEQWIVPSDLIDASDADERLAALATMLERRGWSFPLVLKPDVGERGSAVRVVRDIQSARAALAEHDAPVLVQTHHPGPGEAGIFYYRLDVDAPGRIFSITHKQFPTITGDGRSTLEQLVYRDSRYRMQAPVFLRRHAGRRYEVLAAGETLELALAGNHCQGTKFLDGTHLITPELERRIDEIALAYEGFHFGRFDVRYADVERFMAGEDLAIVELNGITSEATNIYDPDRSLLWAYRTLYRQWAILFEIGAANREKGHGVTSHRQMLSLLWRHFRGGKVKAISD
ncbi:MAG: carboxylate--amine ligase [Planctomycetota bacterium]